MAPNVAERASMAGRPPYAQDQADGTVIIPRDLSSATVVLLSLLFGLLMLWLGPYSWPSTNLYQEMQPILAILEPGAFTRDFAVQSYLGNTPRDTYQWIGATLARAGLSLSSAHLLLQTITMVVAAATLLRAASWLSRPEEGAAMRVFLAAVMVVWVTSSSHRGWDLPLLDAADAVPSTFATGLAICGWYSAMRSRWLAAFSLFGVAALLQFLVGFIPGLLLAPVMLADLRDAKGKSGTTLPMLLGLAVWGTCMGFVAVPMMLAARATVPVSSEEIVRLFGYVRHPHHWVPSSGGSLAWLNHAFEFAAGLMLARELPTHGAAGRLRRTALIVIPGTALVLLLNFVFVELIPVAFIGKLQFQRALPFSLLAILLVLAALSYRALQERRPALLIALILAPLVGAQGPALAICAGVYLLERRFEDRVQLIDLCAAAAIVALGSLPYPINFFARPMAFVIIGAIPLVLLFHDRLTASKARVALLAALIMITAGTAGVLWMDRDKATGLRSELLNRAPAAVDWRRAPDDIRRLSASVAANTPDTALILLPPTRQFTALPFLSVRSVVFTWKNMPYTDAGMLEWGERLESLMTQRVTYAPSDSALVRAWAANSPGRVAELAKQYDADYVVTSDAWHPMLPMRRIATTDGWTLWHVRQQSSERAGVEPISRR